MRTSAAAALALIGLVAACAELPAPQEIRVLSVPAVPPTATSAASAVSKGHDVVLVEQAEGQVARLEALLEEVKARAAQGELTDTDVAQVESRLAAAKARQAALQGALAASCARYRELVGEAAPGCAI